ncbi:outer membrane beta-barrel protein [Glacieibacterium frigidum]|uniref:Outer membrane beta-barrel protein n=1 Tax=Glacieibacterium frigidum TaxID=2593303 RepID=A0A552UIE6_9SPHN|nr:outer membrane beta-barrel protein [Glacieibacterium frigidum]TRW17960.1 outer membrane beta-barrel protein [Glacieibacterium frigidum]
MTKTKAYVRVATMLLACGLTAPAVAQRAAGDDDPIINTAAPATDGIGSVLGGVGGILLRGLSISAQLQTTYDGDIRRLGEGLRDDDDELADFRISPSVKVSNVMSVGRQQLYVEGEYGRDFYVRNTDLNRDRYGIAGGINAQAGSFCKGNLAGYFRSRQQLNSEATIGISNLVETTNFSASANCQRPVGIGFGLSASHNKQDNKDLAREFFDSRSNTIGGNVSYSRPLLGTFSLGGSYSDVKYPSRSQIIGGTFFAPITSDDGVGIYSGNLSYRRSIGPRLTVNIGGSYFVAKSKPRDVFLQVISPTQGFILQPQRRENFSGAGYIFGLAYRPGARLTIDVSAARDISESSNVGALFTVRDNFGVDLGYRVGPSITAGIGATFDVRRYRNPFSSPEEIQPRVRDDIGRVYGRVTYAPRRLFNVDFELAHQRRNSNPSIYDYASTSAALTLRVNFGRG